MHVTTREYNKNAGKLTHWKKTGHSLCHQIAHNKNEANSHAKRRQAIVCVTRRAQIKNLVNWLP